jgi:hypothetical protein
LKHIPFILIASAFCVASVASEQIVTETVNVRGQTFLAALTTYSEKPADKFIVAAMGTGVYCAQKNIPSEFAKVVAKHSTAVLTIEKPGVDCASQKPVSREAFARHSREDVVQATAQAILWAEEKLGVKAPSVLWGHSEGSQVMANVIRNHSKLFVDRPLQLMLTSPAMNFQELLEFQISDQKTRDTFRDSIKRKDDAFLLKSKNGSISAAYWESILADKSLAETLEQNLFEEKDLSAAVFWGTNDSQCSANSTCGVVSKLQTKFPKRVYSASFQDGHSIENHMEPIAKFLESALKD